MSKYSATLLSGSTYTAGEYNFVKNVSQPIDEATAKYLGKLPIFKVEQGVNTEGAKVDPLDPPKVSEEEQVVTAEGAKVDPVDPSKSSAVEATGGVIEVKDLVGFNKTYAAKTSRARTTKG